MSAMHPASSGECLHKCILHWRAFTRAKRSFSLAPGEHDCMLRLRRVTAQLAAAGFLGLLAACASQPSLVPAPDAERVSPGGSIARDSAGGVTVTVDPDAWRGGVNIESAVTPMHVKIENRSDHKLRIRYGDFALVSGADRYVALPPYDIRATVAGRGTPRPYPPNDSLAFGYDGFYVSPFYHTFYPGLSVWHGHPVLLDPYYDHYYPYWQRMRIELPTAEMLRYALPEGVLEEGGSAAGFLYFERVDTGSESRVAFNADFVDIVSDETVTTLEVPFVVRKED